MKKIGEELDSLVRATLPNLEAITEGESLMTRGPGTWSRKQILGHMIDSGLNNVHRFVRAQAVASFAFPGYEQQEWVDRGGYQDRSWASLVQFWGSLNFHIAQVIIRIPPSAAAVPCVIGTGDPVTLAFIIEDYVRHLRHHLDQVLDPEGSKGKAHVRW